MIPIDTSHGRTDAVRRAHAVERPRSRYADGSAGRVAAVSRRRSDATRVAKPFYRIDRCATLPCVTDNGRRYDHIAGHGSCAPIPDASNSAHATRGPCHG